MVARSNRSWLAHGAIVILLVILWIAVSASMNAEVGHGPLVGLGRAIANLIGLALLLYVLVTTALMALLRRRRFAALISHGIVIGLLLALGVGGAFVAKSRSQRAADEIERARAEHGSPDASESTVGEPMPAAKP